MKIKCKKLDPNAILPTYATDGSGCFDLYATAAQWDTGGNQWGPVTPDVCKWPVLVKTGLAFEIPPGHTMFIFSRSGHGFKNATRLANCVGVIDADFKGEVCVKLTRDNYADERTPLLNVRPGDRIAQAMIIPVPTVEFEEVDELSETARGAGGFGSTGA